MKRASFWILAVLLASGTARAQSDQAQLTRPQGVAQLNAYLARLGTNPRDVSALIGAGEAALALDDPNAAAGFFARADAIESGNGRIKAGLAKVMLQMRNPAEALRLFDQAGRLGYADTNILPERGLARDMSGDQAGAQQDYRAALARSPGAPDLVYRYAASLGISGQVEAAEHVLQPLLYKSDRAAWRYRAFILAMNNRQADAKKIAMQTLPENIAVGLIPYMQKMPYLTAAQKAAAVHFGHFPAQVGTQITKITPTPPASGPGVVPGAAPTRDLAAAATPAVPEPAPRATRSRSRDSRRRAGSTITRAPTQVAQATTQQPGPTAAPPAAPAQSPSVPTSAAAPAPARPAMIQPIPQSASQTPTRSTVTPVTGTSAAAPSPTVSAFSAPFPASTVFPVPTTSPGPSAPARQGPPTDGFVQAIPRSTVSPAAPVPTQPVAANSLNAISLAQASVPRTAIPANPPSAQTGSVPPSAPPSSSGAQAALPIPAAPPATLQPLPPSSQAPAQTVAARSAETASALSSPPPAAPAVTPTPVVPRSLAEIIRAIDVPDAERRTTVAAVNLDEIAAMQAARRAEQQAAAERAKKAADAKAKAAEAKAKAEADAKAKKEAEEKARLAANPARSWVQIGVGANRSALPFTLKQLRGKYAEIAPQDAWSASWGRTNRLLIGPFPSFTRAKSMEQSLKAKGADAFAWRSEAGEMVERLGGN
ncbi:MAG: tetratricopeptide repeat protein [Sphingobium sp.]